MGPAGGVTFFSGLKQTMGATLTSRRPRQLLAEAAFKVFAYTLRCQPNQHSHE